MTFATVSDRYTEDEVAEFYSTGQWQKETLLDLLEIQVEAQGDRVFLTDDTTSVTFAQLRDRGIGLAVGLKRLGVSKGDRVSVQIPNWSEFAQIALALSRIGAIMVPIMPIYRRDEVGYILDNAQVKVSISAETFKKFDYRDMYVGLRDSVDSLDTVVTLRGSDHADGVVDFSELVVDIDADAASAELGQGVGPDDHFVIVYSSGTTSRPKGCLHTFNTLACGSRLLAKGFQYTPADVQFGPSPVTHTTGLVTSIILPMMHGGASHIMESWEPRRGMEQIRQHKCTAAVSATTFLQMLMNEYDPERDDMSSMRLWTAAGSPIPGAFVEEASRLFPKMRVLSLYGRSESVTTTMCTIDDDPSRSVTSDGKALPMQGVRIVDPEGAEVPRGTEGDIAYKGAMHMLEYIGKPAETAELFTSDGYSKSGDLGIMDDDGFVRVSGRTKDIVIRGGLNISVRQLEDLLTAHPAVRDVAAVGMPDERLGETVCCFLVPTPGHESITLGQIKDYLVGAGLAIQKVPERLEIVDALPTTATGKIQKHLLRKKIAEMIS